MKTKLYLIPDGREINAGNHAATVVALDAVGWPRWAQSCGVLLIALTVMAMFGVPAKAATSYAAVCHLPQKEIHYFNVPTVDMYGGSQVRFANTDVSFFPPSLDGLSLAGLSATLPIDFPVKGSNIRFFYALKPIDKYGNMETHLVGCLYFNMDGKPYVLSNAYGPEGNETPIIVSMFTLDLARHIGGTLFVIIRWDNDSSDSSGYVYDVHMYGVQKITEPDSSTDWSNFQLSDLSDKVFGDDSGLDGTVGNDKSSYSYKDRAAIVQRLKQLGYLK